MSDSPQVTLLREELKRPLFDIDACEPEVATEALGESKYRKCYRLNASGEVIALNLSWCQISDGSFLTKLPQLTTLSLSGNEISDYSFLTKLLQLTKLDLSGNEISDYSFLTKLPQLTKLDLSGNEIFGYSFLMKLPQLTKLDLGGNEITDGSFLTKLPQLTKLGLNENRITDYSFLTKLPQLTKLDLSFSPFVRNQISDYYRYLTELPQLSSLSLRYNQITDGSFLTKLPQLTKLDLSGNKITDGNFLIKLPQLSALDLGSDPFGRNEISDYSFLTKLPQLTKLDLSGNGINGGSFLTKLPQLTMLSLSGNEIFEYSFLTKLPQLTTLNLSGNEILDSSFLTKLPQLTTLRLASSTFIVNEISDSGVLTKLPQLTTLYLRGTKIFNSSFLTKLPRLRTVDLRETEIREIPDTVAQRIEIESNEHEDLPGSITIHDTPLKSPPLEIVERGYPAVMDWMASREMGEERPLNELKLILVGDGGAGKTTLMKRLLGEAIPDHEPQTDGINIVDWTLDACGSEVLTHIWDFGGQEIMHATHQFFLSHRSVYVLVLDGRKEEDPEYWLQMIRSFGGNSPVLIVLNKIDENPGFDIDRKDLRRKHEIHDFYRISAKAGGGVDHLRQGLCEAIGKVDWLTTLWGAPWLKVKADLREIEKDYIDYTEYERLCRDAQVPAGSSQETLVTFLNDLGIIVYFGDTDLNHTHVLNPHWVTNGVYRILNAQPLADAKGILDTSRLTEILKQRDDDDHAYPLDKHAYLLSLMRKFELCYDLGNSLHLVPDLLDVPEPDFVFDESDCLRFTFQYDYLPRSIFPRFLVRQHHDIEDELRWRTGGVLKDRDSDARAVVRVDHRARRLVLLVAGPQRRDYFSMLRREFRRLHKSFEHLPVEEQVALPGHPNESVDYEELVGLERMGKADYTSGKLQQSFPVKQLLDGIDDDEAARERRTLENTGGDTHYHTHEHVHEAPEVPEAKPKEIDWDVRVLGRAVFFGLLALLVFLVPTPGKVALGVIGAAAFYWLNRNPKHAWQHAFRWVTGVWILANTLGLALSYTWKTENGQAVIEYNGALATTTNVLFALVAIACIVADVVKRR